MKKTSIILFITFVLIIGIGLSMHNDYLFFSLITIGTFGGLFYLFKEDISYRKNINKLKKRNKW